MENTRILKEKKKYLFCQINAKYIESVIQIKAKYSFCVKMQNLRNQWYWSMQKKIVSPLENAKKIIC